LVKEIPNKQYPEKQYQKISPKGEAE
jgi:hypothetical protein